MTVTGMKQLRSGVAVAGLAMVLAACGGGSSGGTATVSAGSGGSGGTGTTALGTHSTSIGTVLADSKGHTVYELAGDTASHQICDSSCQAFWPPVMSGNAIMVVNGHPVFTFVNDSSAGQTHGQKVKDTWGTWFALNPKGNPIGAAAAKPAGAPSTKPTSSASSSSGSGGGYGY